VVPWRHSQEDTLVLVEQILAQWQAGMSTSQSAGGALWPMNGAQLDGLVINSQLKA